MKLDPSSYYYIYIEVKDTNSAPRSKGHNLRENALLGSGTRLFGLLFNPIINFRLIEMTGDPLGQAK